MIKITPRFFVLPLIALAVIMSLPRSGVQACVAKVASSAGLVRADVDPVAPCAAGQEIVLVSSREMIR